MTVLNERIEEIATLIAEVANGNFDYKVEISKSGDELDAVINGVNMLGEELKNSTVSRDYMQSILQGIVDMLLILDTDFNIRTVNHALEEMTGYKEEEIKGLHLAQLIDSGDNPMLPAHMDRFNKQGKCLNVEVLLTTKKGRKMPTSCSFSYLKDNSSDVSGILIIAKDITKLKQTEQDLMEAKNKAETANEAKSNFLSNMSHEIRTPLNGIMGFTDLLAQSPLNDTQKKYLDLIKTSGSALTNLLHDILDLHRIEQDKITIEKVPFNYKKTLEASLEPYKHLAKSKYLTFSNTFHASIPEMVIGDPNRITQILINLISNAIKFTEQGNIKVHHRAEYIAYEDVVKFTCTVTDTGIGIPNEKQAKIFEHFTQSDESITRKYGGSGLGLTISKKLLDLMNGDIGVISPVPGQDNGTSFWFNVKLKPTKYKESNEDLDEYSTFKLKEGTQILVADDNEINVVLIHDLLKGLGAEVTTVVNGKEAVDKAMSEAYSLVFMDLQMPIMNGMEATEMLRMSGINTPVIAFSAAAYKDDINKSLDAGMNDYLCKPFAFNDLIGLLKKWT